MVLILFAAFLGLSVALTLANWRYGPFLMLLCGILQDPVRKMTPGTPVLLTMTIVLVFGAILVRTYPMLMASISDINRRFPSISLGARIMLFFLVLAAINGLMTFGFRYWKVPFLSLFTYVAPIPAMLVGYLYLEREEVLFRFFRFYAAITSIALIGTVLELMRFDLPFLGMVAVEGDQIRHLPGIQIRMLSGIYRAPDVMAWHAATLTSISIALAIRGGLGRRAWPWLAGASWGFFCCLISGRRKAVYFVVAFAVVFVWRYIRRLRPAQIFAIATVGIAMMAVTYQLSRDEKNSAYTQGATATRTEITERLEGGVRETFRQFGIMGAGLGVATQGVQHLLPPNFPRGWQEAGLGKIAVELGLPGIGAALFLAFVAGSLLLKLTAIGDVRGSSQLGRVTLFALVCANILNFMASAQAYSDPVLALITALFVGFLFATASLDERLPATEPAPAAETTSPLTAPATA